MPPTVADLLKKHSQKIVLTEVRLILACILKQPIEFLIAHPEYKISTLENWKIKIMVTKRAKGVPLAYLTGHKEFFSLDFIVNKHTLVPRPETEVLVEEVLKELQKDTTLIDIGTGSGCIPISILKSSGIQSSIITYATDISKYALKIARKNATTHNVEITFLEGNLLEPVLKNSKLLNLESKLIITANLPYLTQEQFKEESSIQHEPYGALVAEDNGLALYKKLLNQIQFLISHFQFHVSVFFEIDPSQTAPLLHYIQSQFPKAQIKIIKDHMENNRVIHIIIDKPNHS